MSSKFYECAVVNGTWVLAGAYLGEMAPIISAEIAPLSHGNATEMKEGNILFNDALNTFDLRLYGVGHMVKEHSDSKRGNLPPHGLLFLISSKGSFICTIQQTG